MRGAFIHAQRFRDEGCGALTILAGSGIRGVLVKATSTHANQDGAFLQIFLCGAAVRRCPAVAPVVDLRLGSAGELLLAEILEKPDGHDLVEVRLLVSDDFLDPFRLQG